MRRTKIICTLGPAVDTVEDLAGLIRGGMNGARFNFSHGTHASHLATLQRLRAAAEAAGRMPALLLDTKGPEIRVKTFAAGAAELREGALFTLYARDRAGDSAGVSVTYAGLARELACGNRVLLDDGLISLRVARIAGEDVECRVEIGGTLSDNKSINLPDTAVRLPAITDRDREDLRFAVENGYDYVAASFVRTAEDVRQIRACLEEFGGGDIMIIAKIENREGVDNADEIIAAADGLMVARGDLGVEVPAAQVPDIQKKLIQKCRRMGKTVVVATQMLESMLHSPRATRAEVSDVANAVYDGASCVMLSGETASGQYPRESLRTMAEVVCAAEDAQDYWAEVKRGSDAERFNPVTDVLTYAACVAARDLRSSVILTATQSGYTAKMLSRFRPGCPIVALSPVPRVCRQMELVWGAAGYEMPAAESTDEIIEGCVRTALEHGYASPGDEAVITCGVPIGRTGSTNLLRVKTISGND